MINYFPEVIVSIAFDPYGNADKVKHNNGSHLILPYVVTRHSLVLAMCSVGIVRNSQVNKLRLSS